MKWTPEQDRALSDVQKWLRTDDQVYRLFGYAGTGKTTLAKTLAENVDGPVFFAAFTGKAAYVLRQRGCEGATTIHSLIYIPRGDAATRVRQLEADLINLLRDLAADNPDVDLEQHPQVQDLRQRLRQEKRNASRPMFSLNQESPVRGASLVVLDEASMVDEVMAQDLLSFGTQVLVLGDPAQLPPVAGGGFFTDAKPDFMLTDIQRQAADNPIIRLATRVRNGQPLSLGSYGESRVINQCDITPDDALAASQILVGRNRTRHLSNSRMRSLLGLGMPHPMPTDKLVCLRNNHELGLLNGAIWRVEETLSVTEDKVSLRIAPDEEGTMAELETVAHLQHFQGREEQLPWWERKEAQEFGYGYALTVHKSQGSQWPHVLIFDESAHFREHRWRWLYTGLTRAAESVTVVTGRE